MADKEQNKNSAPDEINERNNLQTKNIKGKIIIWLRVFISLILLGILIALVDPVKVKQSIYSFNSSSLPVVFALIVLSMIISSYKWKVLLDERNNKIGFIQLFRIYIISLFFNNFLPSSIGGDGVRIYLAGKLNKKTSSAAASVVIDRAIASISLSFLGLSAIFFAANPLMIVVWPLIIVLIAGAALTLVLLTGWTPVFIKNKKGKLSNSWAAFANAAGRLKSNPAALFVNLILSILFQINVAMVVASVIWGLGLPVPGIADMIYITSASSVFAMVPAGINGYGLREGAYILLLQPYCFSASSALSVSVLFAIFVSIFSLAGGLDWIFLKLKTDINLKHNEVIL